MCPKCVEYVYANKDGILRAWVMMTAPLNAQCIDGKGHIIDPERMNKIAIAQWLKRSGFEPEWLAPLADKIPCL